MAIKKPLPERIGSIVIHAIMIVFCVACLYPVVLAFMASITDEKSLNANGFRLIPSQFSAEAYRLVLHTSAVGRAYLVSIFVTIIGTCMALLIGSLAGYAMSVSKVKYRNVVALYFFIPTLFNAGLVPWYLVLTQVLRLRNSIWALIIPQLVSGFNIFLMRNYFRSIPASLAESAEIDGATPLMTYFRIILPLAGPILATITLFTALGYWNSWTEALWFIEDPNLYPLQYLLYKIQAQITLMQQTGVMTMRGTPPLQSYKMATLFVTIGPIILVYPFAQKYFIKGIMVGAVKG